MIEKLREYKTIYLGGPISLGGTLEPAAIEVNLQRFFQVEEMLHRLGHAVFNPARLPKHNRHGEKAVQEDYLEQCFWMIMQSEAMIALEGWQASHGTLREVMITQSSGKLVFNEDFTVLDYLVIPQVVPVVQMA